MIRIDAVWLAVRRLHQGCFVRAGALAAGTLSISGAQFDAPVLGLPWQMLAHGRLCIVHGASWEG